MDISSQGLFTGTQVNYYIICTTKLWLFAHHITMESGSDLVAMGRFIHETSYEREKKDVIIDNRIGIDFIKTGDTITVHEVKKSKKLERAHRYQLLYYIYYLMTVKGLPKVDGVLDYPESRERVHVELHRCRPGRTRRDPVCHSRYHQSRKPAATGKEDVLPEMCVHGILLGVIMKKNLYLIKNGKLIRKQNTLYFVSKKEERPEKTTGTEQKTGIRGGI